MATKIYYDTNGLANLTTSLSTEIGKVATTSDNLYKEFEKVKDYWKGPDADKYIDDALTYMKTVQLLKLSLEDFETVLKQLKTKIDNYQKF